MGEILPPARVVRLITRAESLGLSVTLSAGGVDITRHDAVSPCHVWVFWCQTFADRPVRVSAAVYHSGIQRCDTITQRAAWLWLETIAS